ncbi:hypothetical protein [uncultured Prevotella sp.]|uniref:hypothetical protein n=1 Tax=uncultured Prevotella sp. TaxID=159272 RepID=UPI002586BE1E|nr:hypothetical protein [uncultured Prevotella sp.]
MMWSMLRTGYVFVPSLTNAGILSTSPVYLSHVVALPTRLVPVSDTNDGPV